MASPVSADSQAPTLPRRGSSFLVLAPTESPVEISRRDSSFLELVPTSSDSFPHHAPGRYTAPGSAMITPLSNSNEKPSVPTMRPVAASPPIIEERPKAHRSNSVASSSSDSSSGSAQRRFLKLGPVHFGGEAGATDFAEE